MENERPGLYQILCCSFFFLLKYVIMRKKNVASKDNTIIDMKACETGR